MKDPNAIWLVLAIVAVFAVYSLLRRRKNLAALETGEDMEALKRAVAQVLPGESGYKVVYAHWQRSESYGRRTTTYYYSYGIAFDTERMFIIPLKFDKDKILPQQPALVTKDNVGVLEVKENRKQDTLFQVSVVLRNKNGESPVEFDVDVKNLRSDRFHHFNIRQQEECEAFSRFITPLAQTVTAENGELREKMARDAIESGKKSSKTMGILSIAFCWIFIAGIIFSVIGLLSAPKPKETGGKAVPGFILCCVGLALSLLIGVGGFILIILS